jgi:hypothetical protein
MSVAAEHSAGMFAGAASGVDAVTADGRVVRIRAVRADDAADLGALCEWAGAETLYRRFFVHGRGAVPSEVVRLNRPPADDHVTLVDGGSSHLIGVASCEVQTPFDVAESADRPAVHWIPGIRAGRRRGLGGPSAPPRAIEELPEVAELDANPVIVRPDGLAVVDTKIRPAAAGEGPDSTLRALRG